MRKFITLLTLVMALLLVSSFVQAQDGDLTDEDFQDLCAALVDQAYATLEASCAGTDVNVACSGHFGTEAFLDDSGHEMIEEFEEPSERVQFITLETVKSREFDLFENEWGIVFKNIQANLARGLGQTARIITFGGVRVEDGVQPPDVLNLPATSVELFVALDAPIFSNPPGFEDPSEPVGTVTAADLPLLSDGTFTDGSGETWFRVFYLWERELGELSTAWVRSSDLELDLGGVDTLPLINTDSRTDMQRIFLSNSPTPSECEQVPPNMIYIQAPQGVETVIYVNEAKVRFTGVATLRVIDIQGAQNVDGEDIFVGDTMELFDLAGFSRFEPNGSIIPPGFKDFVCLDWPRDIGRDDRENDHIVTLPCPRSGVVLADDAEIGFFKDFFEGRVFDGIDFEFVEITIGSGIGGVVRTIRITSFEDLLRFQALCAAGEIGAEICEQIDQIADSLGN